LSRILKLISDGWLVLIVTDQLLAEIKLVTARDKVKKFFPKESVIELIDLLEAITENVDVKS